MALNAVQKRNVIALLKGVKEFQNNHEYSEKVAQRHGRIVLMTAAVESNFYNYANQNVPSSLHHAHDKVGHDHDSIGCLQQRASGTWYPADTVFKKMQPNLAARGFLHQLRELGLAGYKGKSLGVRCQRVQVSAFPFRYSLQSVRALTIRRKYWGQA